LTETPYDEGKDFLKLSGDGGFCRMTGGMFMVLYPQDAHMPGIAIDGPVPVKKIVMKVLL
jgi:biofilm protein TabA